MGRQHAVQTTTPRLLPIMWPPVCHSRYFTQRPNTSACFGQFGKAAPQCWVDKDEGGGSHAPQFVEVIRMSLNPRTQRRRSFPRVDSSRHLTCRTPNLKDYISRPHTSCHIPTVTHDYEDSEEEQDHVQQSSPPPPPTTTPACREIYLSQPEYNAPEYSTQEFNTPEYSAQQFSIPDMNWGFVTVDDIVSYTSPGVSRSLIKPMPRYTECGHRRRPQLDTETMLTDTSQRKTIPVKVPLSKSDPCKLRYFRTSSPRTSLPYI